MELMRFLLVFILIAGSMILGLVVGVLLPRGDFSWGTEPTSQVLEEAEVVEVKPEEPRSTIPALPRPKAKPQQQVNLTFSQLDPNKREASEEAFTPWITPKQAADNWKRWAGDRIPVLSQRRSSDNMSRDVWVDNDFPTGFWVLTDMTYESFLRVHRDKLKIKDELISCTQYLNPKGEKRYWALWLPAKKAPEVKKKMAELGIVPAKLEFVQGTEPVQP